MNRNWGKSENERLVYFDGQMRDGDTWIVAPTAADFARFGWLPVIDEPAPTPPEGYHYEPRGPVEKDGAIVRVTWELVEDPPSPPRIFSCLYLEAALLKRGLLPAFDALLDSQTIEDPPGSGYTMPLRRAYNRANDISSAHPLFGQYFAAAKTALGVSDETAEEILAEAETGGV